jgi:hypothetical protein
MALALHQGHLSTYSPPPSPDKTAGAAQQGVNAAQNWR